MKIITYSKIGYNAPSQANWCYFIWKIDFIDTEKGARYIPSVVVKENFGGDSRFTKQIKEKTGVEPIESTSVYTKTGTPKITGVSNMQLMDSDTFINECVEFLK